jgi:hypothetical protein
VLRSAIEDVLDFEQTITLADHAFLDHSISPVPACQFSVSLGLNLGRALPFLDPVETIHAGQIHMLNGPARPMDFHIFDLRAASQAKMDAKIVRGGIATSADYIAALPYTASRNVDRCSNRIPRALCPSN